MNNRQEQIESGKRMMEMIAQQRKSEAEKKIWENKDSFRIAITDPNRLTSADIARLTPEQIKQFYQQFSLWKICINFTHTIENRRNRKS